MYHATYVPLWHQKLAWGLSCFLRPLNFSPYLPWSRNHPTAGELVVEIVLSKKGIKGLKVVSREGETSCKLISVEGHNLTSITYC